MTPFDLAIFFWVPHLGLTVADVEVLEVPRKRFRKFTAIVGLHLLDGKRQSGFYLVNEVSRVRNGIVVIDPQNPKSRAVVNGRKLIVTFARKGQIIYEFYINLDPVAGNDLAVCLGITLPVLFVFQPVWSMLLVKTPNGMVCDETNQLYFCRM